LFIRMNESLACTEQTYHAGQIYEVSDPIAALWELSGLAEITTTAPPHVTNFLKRLDYAADRPILFLPDAGVEFGHRIMTGIRLAYFHRSKDKIGLIRLKRR